MVSFFLRKSEYDGVSRSVMVVDSRFEDEAASTGEDKADDAGDPEPPSGDA